MTFVGEGLELRILTRGLDEVVSKNGRVVLLSGEPGIGKTRLLAELGTRAAARCFQVLHTQCVSHKLPGAGSPWLRIISDCMALEYSKTHPDALLENLAPEVRTSTGSMRVSNFAISAIEDLLESTPPVSNSFRAVKELLENTSESSPLLITVDDLHHADELSLELLLYLTHALYQSRVLLVTAYRPFELNSHSAQRVVEAIRKNALNLEVVALNERATAEMLTDILRGTPEPSQVRRVYDLTGGNPLFIVQGEFFNFSENGEECRSESSRARVSSSLQSIIEEQLQSLPVGTRKLLHIASAMGETFEPEVAFRVLDCDRESATASLLELERRKLIKPANGCRYGFVQGFVRQVEYDEDPTWTNALLHQRIADALEAQHAHEIERYAREIAEHLLKSRDFRALERAIDYAETAGRRYVEAGEFEAASKMFSIAVGAIDLQAHPNEIRLCDCLIALGEAQKHAGEIRAAQDTLYRAAECAQRLADRRRIAQIVLTIPEFHWPLPGQANIFAALLADRALNLLAERDFEHRAMVTARLAAELSYFRNERTRSAELANTAMKIAEGIAADRTIMLRVLRLRDCILRSPEVICDRLRNANEITALASQIGDWDALFDGTVTRIEALFQLGKISDAESAFQTAEQTSVMSNRPASYVQILAMKAARTVSDGRLAKSDELFRACRELANAQGVPELADRCWPAMVVPLREQGHLAALESGAERSFLAHPNSPVERALQCWLALELGRISEANFHLQRLVVDDFEDLKNANGSLAGAAALAEVCARLRMPDYAKALYDYLLPYANHTVVLGIYAALGPVSHYLGKLAMTISRVDEAIAHFEAALEFSRRTGARTWATYVLAELAKATLFQNAAPERGLALLKEAQLEAASLGMNRLELSVKKMLDSTTGDRFRALGTNSVFSLKTKNPLSEGIASVNNSVRPPIAATARPDPYELTTPSLATKAFCREGEYWTLEYEKRTVRIKHLRGLTLISYLLRRPHDTIHAVDLVSLDDDGKITTESVAYKLADSDLGPVLDHAAKQSYRERTRELRRDLEEAQSSNDSESAAKIEEELRFFIRELARSVGIYGRDRKSGSQVERSRLRVTNAIKLAISKISANHDSLGSHLTRSIKTGTFCCYAPDSDTLWLGAQRNKRGTQ